MVTHPISPRPSWDRSHSPQRRMTVYQTREGRPRWVLHMQAVFWRVLMGLGMFFHRLAPPRPPKANFTRVIPSTISGKPGEITLNFYVPRDYETQRLLWVERPEEHEAGVVEGVSGGISGGIKEEEEEEERRESSESGGNAKGNDNVARRVSTMSNVRDSIRRRSTSARRWGVYPVVINFHGGGFTLGSAGDDARWCGTVVDECHAVVISVDYRLAPEHPFPTAVEDGVDAVIYVHKHAMELGIDKDKIALSGFSSGGNMTFTVPLRLYDEIQSFPRDDIHPTQSPTAAQNIEGALQGASSASEDQRIPSPTSSDSSTKVASGNDSTVQTLDHASSSPQPPLTTSSPKTNTTTTITETLTHPTIPPDIKIACLIPWYPPVDYTRTRAQRRATCRRADQELPALFTDLFDDSYLHPPHTISLDSPYLSPGVAPTALLKNALPKEIIMHTCEWDMLLSEGSDFRDRLTSSEIGKKVWYSMVEGVPHGWDKAPNPWKPTPGVREHYLRACKEMRRVFGPEKGSVRPPMERGTTKGWPTVAPRGSVQVVR